VCRRSIQGNDNGLRPMRLRDEGVITDGGRVFYGPVAYRGALVVARYPPLPWRYCRRADSRILQIAMKVLFRFFTLLLLPHVALRRLRKNARSMSFGADIEVSLPRNSFHAPLAVKDAEARGGQWPSCYDMDTYGGGFDAASDAMDRCSR